MIEEGSPPASWSALRTRTQNGWLDDMGHVNVQYYFKMAAEAIYCLMGEILQGGRPPDPPPLFFTLEARMIYRAELRGDEPIEVFIRPVSRREKTLRVVLEFRPTAPGRSLSAECDWVGAFVDPASRRLAPLPETARRLFDAKRDESPAPPAVPPPAPPLPSFSSHDPLVSFTGTIQPDWIDRMGHMGIEHYMLIFDRAGRGHLAALGFDTPALHGRGLGAAGLQSDIRYLKELKLGDPFEVRSAVMALGERRLTARHELSGAVGGAVHAVCDQTFGLFDLSRRRLVSLPGDFIEACARRHAD